MSRALALTLALVGAGAAQAGERVRVSAQKTGTLAWELDVIAARHLARDAGLDLEVTEYAAPEAGRIALHAGSTDIILSDLMFVARERALGGSLLYAPFSSALGAVMTSAGSPIRSIEDLKGRKIGVAGGPLDKSWLMLRALAQRAGFDLIRQSSPAFGAPKLLAVKLEQGELDAVLNYWNLCADLETKGFRRAIDMSEVETTLGARAPVALVGYAIEGGFAAAHPAALQSFLDVSARARDILARDPAEWTRLQARVGAETPEALAAYRAAYARGAAHRELDAEIADAGALYKAMADIGGADLVGPAAQLDPNVYWRASPEALR